MEMKSIICMFGGVGLLVTSFWIAVSAQDTVPKNVGVPRAVDSPHVEQEAAIRATVNQFVTAYNAHDAKSLAALFLPQAQIVDDADNTVQGRAEIESLFTRVFTENPQTEIEVSVEAIRFVGDSLAIETGVTSTKPSEGGPPEIARYSVVHVQQNGKWSMGLVRDIPAEPTHRDHLQALAWMVGDWIDESREGVVKTSCRWTNDESFLVQEITVHQAGREVMTISQRIGWDPLTKRFKSWVFDSEGGFGEGNWTPTETGWIIKATSVNSDGSSTSATSHIEPTGLDHYVFRSVDRVVGNELLPPVEVRVVRQPPRPE
jgi:uncharacterized protein (TIGR02246 family)